MTRRPVALSRHRPPLVVAALVAAALVVLQSLLVPLFAGPAANLAPRDLPVVVAGPAPVADQLAGRLAAAAPPGSFDVIRLPDGPTADQALRDREAYAALVAGPDGPALHTAPGASPTVAALLTQAVGALSTDRPIQVVEIVPADPDDPRGAGFAAGFLPLALTSLLAGALLTLLVAGRIARLAGLLGFGLLAGVAGPLVLQGWLDVLPGDQLRNGGAIGLTALAVAATVGGLGAALGRPGLGLGALLVFLVGNPLSAVSAAPELLPQPWGTVGQWLPVGAGGTLLRSTAFFDGAGASASLLILVGYAALGLLLTCLGPARSLLGPSTTESAATGSGGISRHGIRRDGISRDGIRRNRPERVIRSVDPAAVLRQLSGPQVPLRVFGRGSGRIVAWKLSDSYSSTHTSSVSHCYSVARSGNLSPAGCGSIP